MSQARKKRVKQDDQVQRLQRKVTRLTGKNECLNEKVKTLEEENRLLKLQLKKYRDKFFKKNKRKEPEDDEKKPPPKKRGAPKGHPGTTRKKPDHVDKHVDVHLAECPECGGKHLKRCKRFEDHYQEDIVLPPVQVTRFRHHFYYCKDCKEVNS